MSFNSYKAYLNSYLPSTPTPQNIFRNNLQNISNMVFEISSNYQVIKHMKRKNIEATPVIPTEWTEVGARIVKPYELQRTTVISDDFIKLFFKTYDYDVLLGDIFEFNNYRWLVVNANKDLNKPNSVLVQRCNVSLRFVEQEPLNENIIEIFGISSKYAMNQLRDGQFIKLPSNQVEVWIPNDVNGRKIEWTIQGGTRFLLGTPYQNWITTSYDNVTFKRTTLDGNEHGIIRLDLELSTINTGMDDLNNGIAWQDYF
jgi:hypothetical protein